LQEEQFKIMGERIQLRRKELGLTQSKLAELLEISNNHLSAIENGKEKPSLEKFVTLCESLDTTPDFLLLGILHSHNVCKNISDSLRLCDTEDIKLPDNLSSFWLRGTRKPGIGILPIRTAYHLHPLQILLAILLIHCIMINKLNISVCEGAASPRTKFMG